jgi:WD40 repeat protein
MSTTAAGFYVTGGTLEPGAPSYLERQADRDLYEALHRGEFCYVLTARQMGKSSLMVRTAARLREEGVAVAVLDLQAVGQNLSVEQWYDGLLNLVGQQLDLEDELDDYWREQTRFGPLQRWMAALHEVVLARAPGRVVIFIDEIDAVRTLPFSTDEFFSGVRECYNRRAQDPEYHRLTFCLLGVAAPSDLISDTRTSPFNIGRRIVLTDFTEEEAAPLAAGLLTSPVAPPLGPVAGRSSPPRSGVGSYSSPLDTASPPRFGEGAGGRGQSLLHRILYWTGGHPYLTQRLCRAIAESLAQPSTEHRAPSTAVVDRLCESLFLTRQAREVDDNLVFVRNRLLRSEADLASLLDLYRQVQRGKRVLDDETNPLASLLRLSGVARSVDGALQVRNRIYGRVFDREWVLAHMPDAELRRQRAAYRRGVLRATAISSVLLLLIGALALRALRSESRARGLAEERRRAVLASRALLYAAQMNQARQAWEMNNVERARALLEAHRPARGEADLRGFEWRHLWHLCRQGGSLATFRGHRGELWSVKFAPNGKLLASGSGDKTVRLWDVSNGQSVAVFQAHGRGVSAVAFSPDGKRLVSGGLDLPEKPPIQHRLRIWDVIGRRELLAFPIRAGWASSLEFSPDGKTLVAGGGDEVGRVGAVRRGSTIRFWDIPGRRELAAIRTPLSWVSAVAFSPDGRQIAYSGGRDAGRDGGVTVWDRATRRAAVILKTDLDIVGAVTFSPDGKTLVVGGFESSGDSRIWLWNVPAQRRMAVLKGHTREVHSVAISPSGRTLASAGGDGAIKLWSCATWQEEATLREHKDRVTSLAFSHDGKLLASGGWDGTLKLWNASPEREANLLLGHTNWAHSVAFSPDGRLLASSSSDGTIRLWDVATGRTLATLRGHTSGLVMDLAFARDGKRLVSSSGDQTIRLWELPHGGGSLCSGGIPRGFGVWLSHPMARQ